MPTVAESLAAIERERAEREARRAAHDTKKNFYVSRAWRALRYKVLAENARRNNGVCRCEACGRSRRDGAVLHVDHVVPRSRDHSRELDPTNTQVLCADCNLGKSASDTLDFRPPAIEPLP